MQVPPVVAPTIPSPVLSPSSLIPTINPSPIILLLILPTLPLLLFGIGARPPNLAKLPFSRTELFLTGGCVTLAGGVVLGLAIWPEGMQAFGSWMSGGGWERWDLAGWDGGWWSNAKGPLGGIGTGQAGAQTGRMGLDQPAQSRGGGYQPNRAGGYKSGQMRPDGFFASQAQSYHRYGAANLAQQAPAPAAQLRKSSPIASTDTP